MADPVQSRWRSSGIVAAVTANFAGPSDAADTPRSFAADGLVTRILPFALVGSFVVVAVALLPPPGDPAFLAVGAILAAVAIGVGLLISRLHLPRWVDVVPLLVGVAGVAALRHAGGGSEAGLVTALALPIVWVALYGTKRDMAVVLAACILVTVLPILIVGGPAYPFSEWRKAVIDGAIGALVVTTIHGLVSRLREQRRIAAQRSDELATKESAIRSILESANDAIVTLRPDGRIVDVNPAALELFRGTREQLLGRDLISTLAVEGARDFLRQGMSRLTVRRDETTSRRFHTELTRLDGETFPVEVSVGVVADQDGFLVHAFARDISERVRAEAAARRHLEDLGALLAIGRELATPSAVAAVRSTICESALTMTRAAMAILFEPDGDDLVVTTSAGRPPPTVRIPRNDRSTATATVFETGVPLYSGRLLDDPRVSRAFAASSLVNAGYWQRIQGSGDAAGVLAVLWDEPMASLDARLEVLLNMLASQAAAALEMSSLVGSLEGLARTDGLTGIANRRTLDTTVPAEMERAARSGLPLSLVMLDLDHFKRYNDAHGHQAGDRLLIDAAAAWQSELRPSDVLARYGGEEFAVVLPDCPSDAATRVAARLRGDVPRGQTVSAGVATWIPGESSAALFARADAALFRAKAEGRDRVVTA